MTAPASLSDDLQRVLRLVAETFPGTLWWDVDCRQWRVLVLEEQEQARLPELVLSKAQPTTP